MLHGVQSLAAFGRQCVFSRGFIFSVLMVAACVCDSALQAMAAVSNTAKSLNPARENAYLHAPVKALSQHKRPAVVDCLLERPIIEGSGIHITYPALGNERVDNDIKEWVTGIADAFAEHLDYSSLNTAIKPEDFVESFEAEDNLLPDPGSFELWGQYQISRPSSQAVSIAFELWNYTGSPEGNLDILTLNYSLLTGQRLTLVDIFEKPEVALELMSAWSRKTLEPRLGAARRAAMLAGGTEPLPENFSSLTLTPEGICINFQPWQVAPQSAGIQKVMMPLEELMPSQPLLALWGK